MNIIPGANPLAAMQLPSPMMSAGDPYAPLISDFFSTLQGMPGAGLSSQGLQSRTIAIDVIERDNEFVIRADIPGVNKDEISVSVEGDVVRISHKRTTIGQEAAKREKKDIEEQGFYHRAERVSSFRGRNIRMPHDANLESIKAKYEDGVLSVACPKIQATETGAMAGKEVAIE